MKRNVIETIMGAVVLLLVAAAFLGFAISSSDVRRVPGPRDRALPASDAAPGRCPGLARDLRRGICFASANLSLDAAVQGYGVALGDQILAAEDLASGALVRPQPGSARLAYGARLPRMAAGRDRRGKRRRLTRRPLVPDPTGRGRDRDRRRRAR